MKNASTGRVQIASKMQDAVKSGTLAAKGCEHIPEIQNVTPSADGCEDCLNIGDNWVNLRLCLTCGYVGCCDSSKNKHATHHSRETHHPLIASYEEGETWVWCYPDEVGFQF